MKARKSKYFPQLIKSHTVLIFFYLRWSFFLPDDVPLLYPTYDHSLDPIFEVQVCNPNYAMYPLFALATVQECVLEPGDILFVPAGCPHHVENLTDTVAISANFVDESNFDLVKRELGAQGHIDAKAKELLRQLESETFDDVSSGVDLK